MRTRSPCPSRTREMTSPVASTWPYTKWLPRRSPRRSEYSRFTVSPSCSDPRFERASVSGTTSNSTTLWSTSAAVKQTPLTAIESLASTSSSDAFSQRKLRRMPPSGNCVRPCTVPVYAMSPLNIGGDRSGDEHVVFQPFDAIDANVPQPACGTGGDDRHGTGRTQECGRDEPVEAIDGGSFEQASGQGRAALAQQAEDSHRSQVAQGLSDVEIAARRVADETHVRDGGKRRELLAGSGGRKHYRVRVTRNASKDGAARIDGSGFAKNDSNVVALAVVRRADRELRIVDSNRSGSDGDRVVCDA